MGGIIERWAQSQGKCEPEWEAAFCQFETRRQETAKFLRRLRRFGAHTWSRDAQVVELFCGRGSGLEAWRKLGFDQIEGVDISESLLRGYAGKAKLYLGDCRRLELPDASRDIICVQGGLHHLPALPEDLRSTTAEIRRVLKPGGRFLVVEPWETPFLDFVHWACRMPWLRRLSTKIDIMARVIDHESRTYFNWLSRPEEILAVLTGGFETEWKRIAWGKLFWLGRKPSGT